MYVHTEIVPVFLEIHSSLYVNTSNDLLDRLFSNNRLINILSKYTCTRMLIRLFMS